MLSLTNYEWEQLSNAEFYNKKAAREMNTVLEVTISREEYNLLLDAIKLGIATYDLWGNEEKAQKVLEIYAKIGGAVE